MNTCLMHLSFLNDVDCGIVLARWVLVQEISEQELKSSVIRNKILLWVMTVLFSMMFIRDAVSGQSVDVEHYGFSSEGDKNLPFSEAVRVGHLLFLSGQVGNVPGTMSVVPGGIQAETRQTMENIKAALEKHGSSLGEVVKCTVFLADISEWSAMNEVYIKYFPVNPPARSALGTNGLALGARTEIECIATVSN